MIKAGWEFFWKGIVIGLLNIVILVLAGAVLTGLGLKFPQVQNTDYIMLSMFISGFVLSIIGGIVVKHLTLAKYGTFTAIFLLFFLNSVTQILEALYFAPGIVNAEVAPAIMGQQLIMYAVLSAGITLLFKNNKTDGENVKVSSRPLQEWLLRVFAGAGSYVLFYSIFGSINAKLFTGRYYQTQVSGLSLPSTLDILALEPIRALILVLSLIPLVLNLNLSRQKCAVLAGTVLFVIGGLLPMLQQLNNLPTVLVVSSTVEMFLQFFLTGIVATYALLYEKADKGMEI